LEWLELGRVRSGGVVKAKWHSTASTGLTELLDDIFAVGPLGYLVVGVGRIKHAEAIVVRIYKRTIANIIQRWRVVLKNLSA
jgi:hypothetical protein